MKKGLKYRCKKGVDPWKYRYITVCLILSLILNIAYIALSLDFMKRGKGIQFEKADMTCFEHMNTRYCCGKNRVNVMTTYLNSTKQINWTYYPGCYKIQISEVVK